MVRLTPKRSPSESSGSFAPGSSACSMMARRSARQITPTLSDGTAELLAARGAIGESLNLCFGWRSIITIVHEMTASIACSLRGGLHKRNPRASADIRDIVDL
jgi:hypothetical protein